MNNSICRLLLLWLKNANYIFDESQFRKQFLSHPDAPGITAITDSLNDLSIDNAAIEIPFTELHKLVHPFMAHIKQEREEQFALVQQKDNNQWELKMEIDKQIVISSQKFKKLFSGTIVIVDPAPATHFRKTRNLVSPTIFFSMLILVGFMVIFINNPFPVMHFLLAVTGLLLSILIVAKELGLNTGRFEKLCNIAAETDCDAVLQSRYSKLFGKNKLSDLSLVFFAIQTVCWLFLYPNQPAVATFQFFGSVFAVPVTLASLYVQRVVLKKWCTLCLLVCTVLWLQTIVAVVILSSRTNLAFTRSLAFTFVITAIVLWMTWQFVRHFLQKTANIEELSIQLMAFKRNYRLFMPLYRQLPELNTSIAGIEEIVLGTHHAPMNMIIVSNPFCNTCIALHKELHRWLLKHPEVNATIRFFVPVDNSNDRRTLIAAKLVELYRNDQQAGITEMNAWYDNPDTDDFYRRNSRMHNSEVLPILRQHRQWCLENDIMVTPTIIINKKRFPLFYDPEDIGFFLEELIRTAKTSLNHPASSETINAVLS